MICGSTPAVAQETIRTSGVMPRRAASASVISTVAAAPSLRPDALAAVTVPSLSNAGRSFCIASSVAPCANIFVAVDDGVALAALDGDGDDLVLELAGLLRGFGLVLRGDRELVLVVTRDLELAGDILGRVAHVIAVEGVPQPVLDHRIDELQVAHLGAGAQMLAVRRQRHRFLAAGHDDRSVAAPDLLHAERDGAQAGTADLVEPPGGRFLWQAGADRCLARRVLALPGGQHLAEDDLVDFRALDPGASQYAP